jgi:phosphatidylserine decarboxylase
MSVVDTMRLVMAPPHPAGYPLIAGGLAVLFIGLPLSAWLAWTGLLFTLFCLYFFRDPERVPPPHSGLALAPADGRIVSIGPAVPPRELGLGPAPRTRVSIFLSVFNVHVNRMPVDGTVIRKVYRRGKTINAALDKASDDNERNALAVRLPDGRDVAVVQIAGLIAKRIICDVTEGSAVRAGDRFGIIRFGSRTDLYLPNGVQPLVCVGQTMIGGETVIADLGA